MTMKERREQTAKYSAKYYAKNKKEVLEQQKGYKRKKEEQGEIRGFFGCKDCRTCQKVCRHNHNEKILSA